MIGLIGGLLASLAVPTSTVGTSSTSIFEVEFVAPTLLSAPSAPYPEAALAQGVQADVLLELQIDELGQVQAVQVLRDPGLGLGEAARQAAHQFRFTPALEAGVPISVVFDFTYRFRLPPKLPQPEPHPQSNEVGLSSNQVDAAFTVVVQGERPPRSATDWTFQLGVTHAAPPAGGSGAELMKKAPGVYLSQHSGQGKGHQIFLRGFDAVHGQDTAINVGGIAVNDVSGTHAQGYVDLHFVIPEVVQKLRVLAGTYDPRQGDFAVAGSMDFVLGLSRRGLMARTTAGQYGLLRALVAWGPESQGDETFVAAEMAKGSGFGPSRAWNRGSAIAQHVLSLGNDLELRLLGSTYAGRYDAAGVVRLDDFEAGRVDRLSTYDPAQGGASNRHQVLAELRYRPATEEEASLALYMVERGFRLRQNFTGFLLDPRGDRIEQTYGATVFGGTAFYRRPLGADWIRGELGASWRHDRVERSQERLRVVDGQPYLPEADDQVQVTDLGLFGDLELRPHDRLRLRGGLRLESFSFVIDERLARAGAGSRREAFGFHAAPKVTLEFRATPVLHLFGSYGNGFRSPQATSLRQGERSPLTVVHSSEVGARFEASSVFRSTLAGFLTYVGDDLVFDHATGQNLFAGPTIRGGGVILAESELFEQLHLTGSVTYTYAYKTESNERAAFVPPLVARLDADTHHHLGELWGRNCGVFGSTSISVLGPRPLPFDEQGQPIFLVEAAMGVEYGPGTLSLEVLNLTDADWRDSEFVYASSFGGGATQTIPVRHFTAGAPFTAQLTLTLNH